MNKWSWWQVLESIIFLVFRHLPGPFVVSGFMTTNNPREKFLELWIFWCWSILCIDPVVWATIWRRGTFGQLRRKRYKHGNRGKHLVRRRRREKDIYWRNKVCDGGRTNEPREIVQYSIWPESAMNQMEVLMKIERGTNIEKCFESCLPIIYTMEPFDAHRSSIPLGFSRPHSSAKLLFPFL